MKNLFDSQICVDCDLPAILVRVDLLTDTQFTTMMLKGGGAETVLLK